MANERYGSVLNATNGLIESHVEVAPIRNNPPFLTVVPEDDPLFPLSDDDPPPHPPMVSARATAMITARLVRARIRSPIAGRERPILRRPPGEEGSGSTKEDTVPHLATSNARIAYEQTGDGPDIVWVSGGGDVGATWHDWQIPAFPGYRHTTFDNRGAGATDCGQPTPWTIADFARDTAELIEAVCDPPVIVAGLSMG